jgi:hypothetical protein
MNGSNRFLHFQYKWRTAVLLLLAGMLLSGCQGSFLSSSGKLVPPRDRITLAAAGEQSGSWETRDLLIHYKYVRTANRLQISGNMQFGDYLRKVYPSIIYFHAGMLMLNEQGRVLATRSVATTNSYANSSTLVPFRATYDLPPGTTAIAFTYTGQGRSISSGDGAVGTSFYYYP